MQPRSASQIHGTVLDINGTAVRGCAVPLEQRARVTPRFAGTSRQHAVFVNEERSAVRGGVRGERRVRDTRGSAAGEKDGPASRGLILFHPGVDEDYRAPGAIDAAAVVRRGHVLPERRACRTYLPSGVNGSARLGLVGFHNGTGSEAQRAGYGNRTAHVRSRIASDNGPFSHAHGAQTVYRTAVMVALIVCNDRILAEADSALSIQENSPAAVASAAYGQRGRIAGQDGIVTKRHALLGENSPAALGGIPGRMVVEERHVVAKKDFPTRRGDRRVVRHQPGAPVLDGQRPVRRDAHPGIAAVDQTRIRVAGI